MTVNFAVRLVAELKIEKEGMLDQLLKTFLVAVGFSSGVVAVGGHLP